jgi:choice-of-anchor B domain-containing protein
MKGLFTYLFAFLFTQSIFAQALNTTLVSSWTDGTVEFNDVWGYVDGSGNEYALVGSLTKFYVVHLPFGSAPVKVGEVTGGGSSVWRDMKTYGTYMYGVADQGGTSEGLTVINLSNLPSSISLVTQMTTHFQRAHNIYIDVPNAKLYVAGSNTVSSGLIVYSLANPASPTLIGNFPFSTVPGIGGGYNHDVHVKNNIAYSSSGGNGLYIYNFTNANATTPPVTLGYINNYPYDGYNHSGWLSSDGNRFVMADETHGTKLKYVDVSDLTDPQVNTSNIFRHCIIPTDTSCIPHNPFIKGDLCYVAYYHDGLVVFNMSNPSNIQRVAYYDTYAPNTNYSGYQGAWGTYPYLPSNRILISDITYGLRVVNMSGALPVDLTNFRAKYQNEVVNLSWETDSELNNKQFEVERSQDGVNWEQLAIKPGFGSTSYGNSYRFTDENPFSGDNYYRLKQVDFDNHADISKSVHVRVENRAQLMSVFPTVVPDDLPEIQVELPSSAADIQLALVDMQGKSLRSQTIAASESPIRQAISVQNLPKGIYTITAFIDGQVQSIKLVK